MIEHTELTLPYYLSEGLFKDYQASEGHEDFSIFLDNATNSKLTVGEFIHFPKKYTTNGENPGDSISGLSES